MTLAFTLTLLTLSGCGRMRSPDWSKGGGRSDAPAPGPQTSTFRSLQTLDNRTCAITAEGALYCWGDNRSGQTMRPPEWSPGMVMEADRSGPVQAFPSPPPTATPIPHDPNKKKNIISLSTANHLSHLCAVIGDGSINAAGDIHCYGTHPSSGVFGPIDRDGKLIQSADALTFTEVKTSGTLTCGLTFNGQLACVGQSTAWTSQELSLIPLPDLGIMGGTRVMDFAVGEQHACVILNDDGLYCWGDNSFRQLGVTTPPSYSVSELALGTLPKIDLTLIGGTTTFFKVYASVGQTCAINKLFVIYCWGKTLAPQRVSLPNMLVRSASLGTEHNCMVYDTTSPSVVLGMVSCAGVNLSGQLGINTFTPYESSLLPVQKMDGSNLTGVDQVSVGNAFSCARMTATQQLWCWGRNSQLFFESDRLSTGMEMYARADITRSGSSDIYRVATGNRFHCTSRSDGTLHCVGVNIFQPAQEGIGGTATYFDSTPILGPYHFGESPGPFTAFNWINRALDTNSMMTCASAWNKNNALECWGTFDDLNNGAYRSNLPAKISGLERDVVSVSMNESHMCAIKMGALYCWGDNSNAQVNGSSSPFFSEPVLIFQTGVTAVSTGLNHTCAIVLGDLVCWGDNGHYQIGVGRTSTRIPYPVRVLTGEVVDVVAGDRHTCAIRGPAPNRLLCWGRDTSGALGNGPGELSQTSPQIITLPDSYIPTELAAGSGHTCAKAYHPTNLDRKLFCWGKNNAGQFGVSPASLTFSEVPLQIGTYNLSQNTRISAKGSNTCFAYEDMSGQFISCMGANDWAQLGLGQPSYDPRTYAPQPLPLTFTPGRGLLIAASYNHLCFSDGSVQCLGANDFGQLGNGKNYQFMVASPHRIFADGVTEVAVGRYQTCALRNGNLHCWGENLPGNYLLPFPSNMNYQLDPETIADTGVEHLAGSALSTCISKNGEVRCWGDNQKGLTGIDPGVGGTWRDYASVTAAPPIISGNISALYAVSNRACVLMDQELHCWGDDLASPGTIVPTPLAWVGGVRKAAISNWGICSDGTAGLECIFSPGLGPVVSTLEGEVPNADLSGVKDIFMQENRFSLCVSTDSGKTYCGGDNSSGLMLPEDQSGASIPFGPVATFRQQFSSSGTHSCQDTGGALTCWGADDDGRLGNGDLDFQPKTIPELVGF